MGSCEAEGSHLCGRGFGRVEIALLLILNSEQAGRVSPCLTGHWKLVVMGLN